MFDAFQSPPRSWNDRARELMRRGDLLVAAIAGASGSAKARAHVGGWVAELRDITRELAWLSGGDDPLAIRPTAGVQAPQRWCS